MSTASEWDLIAIGGGSAGLVAAKTAAGFGARVLLVERDRLGGDCLWTGCVPSKALIAAAARGDQFAQAMAAVRAAIAAIAPTDSAEALESAGVAVRLGEARFRDDRSIDLNGQTIRFAQALIGTGSSPRLPPIEGSSRVRLRTSDDLWELEQLPKRLVILGGGPVGCEIGQAMARLGSAVTIIQRNTRLLPRDDEDASDIIHTALRCEGIDVRTGRTARSITSADGESGVLTLDDDTAVPFDVIVSALGREPRATQLHLEAAGVRCDQAGYVKVDASLRTSNPRIWAAGDVTGMPKFTHTAGVNGSIAATNALLGLRRRAERAGIPRVTFTSPEVAAVGLAPAEADSRRHRVITQWHEHSDRAITEGTVTGYSRIVVDRRGRILGGTIVGPRAGESLGELSLAVKSQLTTATVASTTHPYPTYNDAIWNAAIVDVKSRLANGVAAIGIRLLRWLRGIRLR